jgi:hypothetical protein
LTIPLIILRDLKAIDAIISSFTIVLKQPHTSWSNDCYDYRFYGGFIGCCIGIFLPFHFLYSTYYALYNEIIGFDQEDEDQEILTTKLIKKTISKDHFIII